MNAFLRVKVSNLHEKCNFNYRSPKSYMIRWMDVKNEHNDFYQRVGFSWEQIEFLSFTFDFPESEKCYWFATGFFVRFESIKFQ